MPPSQDTSISTASEPHLTRAPTLSSLARSQWTQGIPIEVAPFAYAKVMYDLSLLGSPTTSDSNVSGGKILTLRMGKAKAGPVVSDNGNFIVDAPFPKEMMKDPKKVSGSCFTSSSSCRVRSLC